MSSFNLKTRWWTDCEKGLVLGDDDELLDVGPSLDRRSHHTEMWSCIVFGAGGPEVGE